MNQPFCRRSAVRGLLSLSALPALLHAEEMLPPGRTYDPHSEKWRNFEVITTVQVRHPPEEATVWVPVPSINGNWQRSLSSEMTGNATPMTIRSDPGSGAHFVVARLTGDALSAPLLKVTSRVQTRDRAVDWRNTRSMSTSRSQQTSVSSDSESPASLRRWVEPSTFITTDGIVRETALQITSSARTDIEKVQRIYNWIIVSTYREPKIRGCGLGDIKTMLETDNLAGKCADLNGLFVGLCRASGIPARDLYGLRLGPSAFGYKELGSSPTNLKGAQHCRAEVYLRGSVREP